MERLNMVEKTKDKTTIKSRGLNTLQIMPNELRAYFRLISLAVNSRMTNVYCLMVLIVSLMLLTFACCLSHIHYIFI